MLLMTQPKGLVFTVDLSKLADRELPEGSELTVDEYRRTVEAPIAGEIQELTYIDWGDGSAPTILETTDSAFPTHTYEAVGVYTVKISSATGHLPLVTFAIRGSDAEGQAPTYNMTWALVSLDHFAGWSGGQSATSALAICNGAKNLKYCAPRWVGQPRFTNLWSLFKYCGELEQNIQSFCFDFSQATVIQQTFTLCTKLTGSPEGIFDALTGIEQFFAAFSSCTSLSPPPFVFWKADGSLDTDKFPNLTNANYAYSLCSAALRAQVPTAYGGTLTISS